MALNLLSANQASIETNTTGFTAVGSTITRVTTDAAHLTASLQCVTSAANGTPRILYGSAGSEFAGFEATAVVTIKNLATSLGLRVSLRPFAADGVTPLDIAIVGTRVTIADGWLESRVTYPEPMPAGTAYVEVMVAGALSGETFRTDKWGLWSGAPDAAWDYPINVTPTPLDHERRTVVWQLNRLAETLVNGNATLAKDAAANRWAGTTNLDMLGALNRKAGRTSPKNFVGFRLVCNELAGTSNLDPAYALGAIATSSPTRRRT